MAPPEATAVSAARVEERRGRGGSRGPLWRWLHDHWTTVGKGTLAVISFWWLVTGIIVALQRNEWTRFLAWTFSTALAIAATYVIHRERASRTAAAARRSFLAATAVWMWINVGLYGGWIVGPSHPATLTGTDATLLRAAEAITSLLWHELLAVMILGVAWLHVRQSPNRVALHALVTYWAVLQVAKLNIFFGVANPGARFLPPHLEFLLTYYGPPQNSGFLPVSFFATVGVALIFWWRGWQATDGYLRQSRALLAMLIALAAVEYLLLGVKTDAPLWEVFLKARGY
jgi:putative photosynthetic complex assembly protein 2